MILLISVLVFTFFGVFFIDPDFFADPDPDSGLKFDQHQD